MAQQLYVVARCNPELYERLHRYFLDRHTVAVVLDRRQRERQQPGTPERRQHNVGADLKRRGWATVDVNYADGLGAADLRQPDAPPVVAVIEGLSPAAQAVLAGGSLRVTRFPYAVERGGDADQRLRQSDLRLLLPDREPFRVSRRHCMLLRERDRVWVVDTSSRLGTVVNGTTIGGSTGRVKAELRVGRNDIAIGGPRTPYRFQVTLERQEASRAATETPQELILTATI